MGTALLVAELLLATAHPLLADEPACVLKASEFIAEYNDVPELRVVGVDGHAVDVGARRSASAVELVMQADGHFEVGEQTVVLFELRGFQPRLRLAVATKDLATACAPPSP